MRLTPPRHRDQRTTLPFTDETVVDYIVGLLEDEEEDEAEILEMSKGMLEGGPDGDASIPKLDALCVPVLTRSRSTSEPDCRIVSLQDCSAR